MLPVGDRSCAIACMDNVFGLDCVSGLRVWDLTATPAAVRRNEPITNGVMHEMKVTVRQDGQNVAIQSSLNGQQLISWTGQESQLSYDVNHSLPNLHCTGLHSYNSIFEVNDLKLELQRGGRGYRLGDDWKNPLMVVTDRPSKEVARAFSLRDWNGKKYLISDKPHPEGADGTTWLGRVKWSRPNKLEK